MRNGPERKERRFSRWTVTALIVAAAAAVAALTGCASKPTPPPTARPTVALPTAIPLPATNTPPPPALTPAPSPTVDSVLGAVQSDEWQLGPANARLTIVEYADYQCQTCAQVAPVLQRLLARYPKDVRLVYRHFPQIDLHAKSQLAAEAAEAAGAQGKFWEMHALLFAQHDAWTNLDPAAFRKTLDQYAAQLGLDVTRFKSALDSGQYAQKIQAAYVAATHVRLANGQVVSLPSTPFFLVNDQPYQGPPAYWAFEIVVKLELLKDRQFAQPQTVIKPGHEYTARLHTTKGDIVIALRADLAPNMVNNFVFLAQKGWYDGVTFHRVLPGFVAQTGDPSGTGLGGPGYYLTDEITTTVHYDAAGVVGMANSGPNANGSQFFITLAPAPDLDGKYTIFGKVVRGLAVVQALTPRDPEQNPEAPPGDQILSITIEEK